MKSTAPDGTCLHCGTPVPPTATDPRFCCAGCAYVHELLFSQGLERFYTLRGAQALSPVSPQAMRVRDYVWLEELSAEAEAATEGDGATLRLAVQGLSCMGCIWLIERVFQALPGAIRVEVHATRGELLLRWQKHVFEVVGFAQQLQQFGYLLGKPDDVAVASVQSSSFNRRVGLCGAFAMNSMAFCLPTYLGMSPDFMFASWFDLVAACSATLSLLVGGTWFAERSWRALSRGVLHIDTPITLGILAAWLGSMAGWLGGVAALKYFDFVSIFIFLMLAGRWMQQSAVERNRRRLLQASAVPESVERLHGEGEAEQVSLGSIRKGDRLRIRPGQVCPIDSVLQGVTASLSLEWINGESEAAQRTAGQAVPSGALNIGTRAIEVEAREAWENSLLQRLAKGRDAGEGAPFFAALLRGYLATVVVVGFVGFVWWLARGSEWSQALQVMISVFVVSCPCALGVAAPFADDLAASWMERLGVFVRTHGLWTKLSRVRKIIFDKTGTLTFENPVLRNPEALGALNAEARTALHHLASSNLHPVSRSLFDALGPMPGGETPEVEEIIGQGVRFVQGARLWSLGRPGWRGGNADPALASPVSGDVELCCDGATMASFAFTDALRPETAAAFDALRRKRFELHLLSGDRAEKVAQ
ncbi:MAG: heavy metal translocating P-type ATPase, partial [Roseimicrobium sp.]